MPSLSLALCAPNEAEVSPSCIPCDETTKCTSNDESVSLTNV
jgi:hypothetical protein